MMRDYKFLDVLSRALQIGSEETRNRPFLYFFFVLLELFINNLAVMKVL